ncbi:putative nuclease HARBI1 [Mercenaria mercenaria]|uniref:putative nuclease HARBI1 n=1 Tax=Mercenaria mercenaria TaxID=6596 RepID=UPI00234ED77F|nr:putative nuclease HARBI1 [Mercenaria mercenaria]
MKIRNNFRFIDVVSKWPGSQHDFAIFEACGLKRYLEENNVGHLLGDSRYPLRQHLLTPVIQPADQREKAYNVAHAKGRGVNECAFGVLKARFRCLHRSGVCLPFKPGKCANVILACMRLHNMCIDADIQLEDVPQLE